MGRLEGMMEGVSGAASVAEGECGGEGGDWQQDA